MQEACAKCRKNMVFANRWFQCSKCKVWFCPSCMDRYCLFCRGEVLQEPKPDQ